MPTKMMKVLVGLILTIVMCVPTANASPIGIVGNTGNSTEGLADFTGYLDYDSTLYQLTVSLTNTTSATCGGALTAFVFNNPDNKIAAVTLTEDSSFPNFDTVLGGSSFQNTVNGGPYGQFDIGLSTGANFEGGTPSDGIPVGKTAKFVFTFTGTDLGSLTTQSFIDAYSVPPGDGQGVQFFVARFQSLTCGAGSDKVPAVVPIPGTLMLLGSGALGLVGLRRRRK